MKPDNHLVYIHKDSNHSKAIRTELPESISKRLTNLLSIKEIFENATPIYFEVLQKNHLMDI